MTRRFQSVAELGSPGQVSSPGRLGGRACTASRPSSWCRHRCAEQAGAEGDRIEHASVVPPGYPGRLARLGRRWSPSPGSSASAATTICVTSHLAEQAWLYPCATLLRSGVARRGRHRRAFWPVRIHGAAWPVRVTRRTPRGQVLGPGERIRRSGRCGCSWRHPRTRVRAHGRARSAWRLVRAASPPTTIPSSTFRRRRPGVHHRCTGVSL